MIYVYRGVSIYKISTIVDKCQQHGRPVKGDSIYKISTITVKVVSAGESDNRYPLGLSLCCSYGSICS